MKNIFCAILMVLFVSITSFGQTLDGYKYVFVPTLTYTNGGTDIYGISRMLRGFFESKGFIVLTESSTLPNELKVNPCLSLWCVISSSNETSTVTIDLKNCKGEVYNTTQNSDHWLS